MGDLSAGVSVVVPVYNSERSLDELCSRVGATLDGLGRTFEIVLVDDGSADASWERIRALAAADPRIRGLNLTRNSGQHAALLCGIREARLDVVVTLDDDLQNPPEEIPRLLAELESGFDVVYGSPRHERHGLWRGLASRLTKLVLQKGMGAEVARKISAFRAFRTPLRRAFAHYAETYVSIDVLLTWATTRFSAVEVQHEKRRYGSSNYTLLQLAVHALNMVTGFSGAPLRLATLVGFATTAFGLLVLVYVLLSTLLRGVAVPGFAFLACTVAIFSGAQLFTLGIIGEYLARVHFRSMNRPPYVVRESTAEPLASPADRQ